jgi:hypothetical protein
MIEKKGDQKGRRRDRKRRSATSRVPRRPLAPPTVLARATSEALLAPWPAYLGAKCKDERSRGGVCGPAAVSQQKKGTERLRL